MCSRPILKHFPRLDAAAPIVGPSTSFSLSPSSSSSSSSTGSLSPVPSISTTGPPSPTLTLFPFSTCNSAHLYSPHVHFPPTPRLISSTYPTHSPSTYDRAPIVVERNVCALPERGGRVFHTPHVNRSAPRSPKGSYFHPRAYEACEKEREELDVDVPSFDTFRRSSSSTSLLSLCHDLSPTSSSDSDFSGVVTPTDDDVQPSPMSLGAAALIADSSDALLATRLQYSLALVQPQSQTMEDSDYIAGLGFTETTLVVNRKPKNGKTKKREKSVNLRLRPCVAFEDDTKLDGCLGGF